MSDATNTRLEDAAIRLERLEAALRASGDIVYDWDLETDTLVWQGAAADILGPRNSAQIKTGDDFNRCINPQDLPGRLKMLSQHFACRDAYDCEYRIRQEDGTFCWVHDRGEALRDAGGRAVRMLGSLRAITARKQNEARLEYRANFDELTGHFNKTRLRESLEHALSYAARYQDPGAYMVVGIDKLSIINDAFGYEAADAAIVSVGQKLERCLRSSDVIGRIGGDRFGVALSSCSEASAAAIADKILCAVRMTPLETSRGPLHLTVSIGVVAFPGPADTVNDIMTKAETALQEAKRRGRNCFISYYPSDGQRHERRLHVEITEKVRQALKENRMAFAYQPVVDAKTGKTVYHECLIRMLEKNGQVIPAGVFMPVIEQMGLVRLVDRHTLEMAVGELSAHPTLRLAMNISSMTAADQSWSRSLSAYLKGRRDIARRLIIEITETAAMHDFEESARFINIARELGCPISLDDFGAGYTSFRHLKSLPIDVVKIDGSFIRNFASNPDNQVFVQTMLGLAEGFGLKTVAECVETAEDAALLRDLGVHYLQGYFCGAPLMTHPSQLPATANLAVDLAPGTADAPPDPASASSQVLRA